MQEFRSRLGEDGRIVIPALCRKQLHLESGEELILRIEDNELHISTLQQSLKKAQQLIQRYTKGKHLVEKLFTMRKEEKDHE